MIQEEVLLAYGATFRRYKKDQCIFFEENIPLFYYQIAEGSVRMANIFADGKEFIQDMFKKEESFGEPVLLINSYYPATAIANEDSIILKLAKENFLLLLHDNNDALYSLAQILATRLFRKTKIAKEISGETALHQITTLLGMFKKDSGCPDKTRLKIELSRQRIGDMLGLRVETVIRTMKKLHEDGLISIKNGKAYL
jgi:CRP/FNR family transcriptional regulator, cyclic AMP receptor protein